MKPKALKEIIFEILSDEQYLNALLENSPDNIYFKDMESRFTKVSVSFAKRNMTTPEEMIGKTDFDLYQLSHANFALEDEREIIKTGIPILDKEEREDWLNGNVTWVSTSKMPLYNEKKQIVGTFGISKDITSIKNNESEISKILIFEKLISKTSAIFLRYGTEKFLQALPVVLKELSILFQSDKSYVYYTEKEGSEFQKMAEISLYNNNKNNLFDIRNYKYWHQNILAHKTVFDFKGNLFSYIGPEEVMYLRKTGLSHIIIVPIINHTSLTGYIGFECKKNSSLWLYKYKSLFEILSEIISYAFSNFISEKNRLKAENELLTLMRAVDQSQSLIIILDSSCKIEYANPRYTEFTGTKHDEVIGTVPNFLRQEYNPKFDENLFWQTMEGGKSWETRFQKKDAEGKTIWENISVSPIKSANESITNLIAIIDDISEKVMMENRNAVSQKLESIGQLAAGIAHEINTPMQYIGDNTKFFKDNISNLDDYLKKVQNIIDSIAPSLPAAFIEEYNQLKAEYDLEYILNELPQAIEQTESGIQRVTNIIKAMKDFAHPGTKEKSFSSINDGIETTAEISKNEWKYVANLELNLSPELPRVYCLLDELNQVILNMILNSVHAIEEKYGRNNPEKGEIKISTYQDGLFVIIMVKDNGIGIKEAVLNKIFDPFFTTKEVGKGTGQGLTIVHDIIANKHDGSINVSSTYGTGTEFIIKIPIELK